MGPPGIDLTTHGNHGQILLSSVCRFLAGTRNSLMGPPDRIDLTTTAPWVDCSVISATSTQYTIILPFPQVGRWSLPLCWHVPPWWAVWSPLDIPSVWDRETETGESWPYRWASRWNPASRTQVIIYCHQVTGKIFLESLQTLHFKIRLRYIDENGLRKKIRKIFFIKCREPLMWRWPYPEKKWQIKTLGNSG